MAFASWPFIILFLPAVLAVFFLILRGNRVDWRPMFLTIASFAFYASSGWRNAAIFAVSIGVNLAIGRMLMRADGPRARRLVLLWTGVGINLAVLLAFKVAALDWGDGQGFRVEASILVPLALSYVTFQQIGFIVACYRRQVTNATPASYLFFIAFFPHLIMGPIVRYHDLADQLTDRSPQRATMSDLAVGATIFTLGLAQKVLLADQIAAPVNRVFAAAELAPVMTIDIIFALVGFQLQLFFDFSGYAEMAIGLARMFGVRLPINFDRPLFARDRLDLWRRWHITFVAFMRIHVFLPLVRRGRLPVWGALAITGMLAGLWHGLGWTFLLWGVIQTLLMLFAHWRRQRVRRDGGSMLLPVPLAILLTFGSSCLVGGLFRAPTLVAAQHIYGSLIHWTFNADSLIGWRALTMLATCAAVAWVLPCSRQLIGDYWNAIDPRSDPPNLPQHPLRDLLLFRLNWAWGFAIALLLALCLTQIDVATRFVYVQF